jgi:hypothetical protein
MAKEKETSTTTALEKSNEGQENLDYQNAKATAKDILADFSQVTDEMLQGLTANYLQLKEGTTYNLVFSAMTKFRGDNGGEVDAVELVNQNGEKFINGNTVLVNSLRKVTVMPCLVRIVTGKLQKSGSGQGKYLDMEVYVLPKTTAK